MVTSFRFPAIRLGGALIALLFCTAATPGKTKNLLVNGGFEAVCEADAPPPNWRASDWSPIDKRGDVLFTVEREDVAEGKASARLVYLGFGSNVVIYQDLPRPTEGLYVLKAKCKPAAGHRAYMSVMALDGSGKKLLYKHSKHLKALKNPRLWGALNLRFMAPAGAKSLRVLLRCDGGALFDAASLALLTSFADTSKEPINTAERAAERKAAAESARLKRIDYARKMAMTPSERAWEKVLEANLGPFYLPLYKKAKAGKKETAWDYVKDDPALPRVLLIGDSVSCGYTVSVRRMLAGKVNLHRAPANCGSTAVGLKKLDVWLGDRNWNLIHFNFGIHDQRTAPAEYAKRLETIVLRLKDTGAKLMFATSTPLPEGSKKYRFGACRLLNKAALKVMDKHGIPIDDLYGPMLIVLDKYQTPGDCHFRADGYVYMGDLVAKRILLELSGK